MILKLLIVCGGLLLLGLLLYDRLTGRRLARKIMIPLAIAFAAALIGIAAKAYLT